MKAFFVTFSTTLSRQALTARRSRLKMLLAAHDVDLCVLKGAAGADSTVARLVERTRACPVIALDDRHALPGRTPWISDLRTGLADLTPIRRPQIIYVSRAGNAAGRAQDADAELIRGYVRRDNGAIWVDTVARLAVDLAQQLRATTLGKLSDWPKKDPRIVGQSDCLQQAVDDISAILRQPYGLVTGAAGVGKMTMIRCLWKQIAGEASLIVLPCGSFFKDYYVMGVRRRYGGGRQAVGELSVYLEEANEGLLVLHHVHLLPTALQEELSAKLASAGDGPNMTAHLTGIAAGGLDQHYVKLVGTTTLTPDQLRAPGRLIPELARRLTKRHVRIPTLAQRGSQDVRLLCQDILARICARQKIAPPRTLSAEVLRALGRGHWPNNISDLTAVIEQAVRRCHGPVIRKKHLPPDLAAVTGPPGRTLDQIVADAQRSAISAALDATGGKVAPAARILGRDRASIHRLMRKLGMRPTK